MSPCCSRASPGLLSGGEDRAPLELPGVSGRGTQGGAGLPIATQGCQGGGGCARGTDTPSTRSIHRCTSKQERSGSLWAFSYSAPYKDKRQPPSQCEEGHGCPACHAVGAAVGTGVSGVLAMQSSLLSLPQWRCVDPSCSWEPRHDQPVVSWSSLQGGAFAV